MMAYSTAATNFDEVKEIEKRIDLVSLVSDYIALDRKSKGCCPFHQDDTPSFQVYQDHWHCFGCHEHGGPIKFIQKIRQTDFKSALAIAKEKSNFWVEAKTKTTANNKGTYWQGSTGLLPEWQSEKWQTFAEAQLTAAKNRMTQQLFKDFEKQRGLTPKTTRHFRSWLDREKPYQTFYQN
jgi:DNA primase